MAFTRTLRPRLQIAANLLTGPGAADHLAILSAQQEDFQEWNQELTDPRVRYGGHTISDGAAPLGGNKEGRAATAIWRARRILALEELAAWLTSDHPTATLELDPPSWTLTMPPGWHTVRFPRHSPAPAALHAEWEQGHVLRIDSGRSSAFWPVTSSGAPLPRLAPVLASTGLTGTDPTDKLRLAEMLLLREGSETDPSGLLGPLFIDATRACTAGLITPAERDDLVADADAETTRRISRVLAMLERTAHRPPEVLEQLRALTHSPAVIEALRRARDRLLDQPPVLALADPLDPGGTGHLAPADRIPAGTAPPGMAATDRRRRGAGPTRCLDSGDVGPPRPRDRSDRALTPAP